MSIRKQISPALTRRAFVVGAGAVVAAGLAGFGFRTYAEGEASRDAAAFGKQATPGALDDLDAGMLRITTFAFDTVVDVGVYGQQADLDAAIVACARFDKLFSAYDQESEVWRINHALGQPCVVSPEVVDLVARACAFSASSGGVFDPTIGAVSLLWDFKAGVRPKDDALARALEHVGWRGVEVDAAASTVRLADPQAALDLGGVAKGWIADALANLLRARGVVSAIINLGGNVYALGEKPSGAAWEVGIRDPNMSGGASVATVKVRDRSVVTSGLYERHFVAEDGRDYYHILDPRTGYPAPTDLRSDTVISQSSFEGDALSTTLFIDGSARAQQVLETRKDVDALFMTEDGTTSFTPNFDAYHYTPL